MKKFVASVFLSLTVFTGFSQPNKWFTVKAFLPNLNGTEVSLLINNQLIYSATVVNDIFSYTSTIDLPMEGLLKVKTKKNSFYFPVFLEPGTIKIRDAGNKRLVSYGTPYNDLYFQLNKSFDSLA